LLTVEKKGKKNIFSGRILEIEGLPKLKVEQAFEISDASAERSAAGCTIKLDKEPIIEYLTSNITMLRWMIEEHYGDARTIDRRVKAMEAWLANPVLMEADKDAEYAEIIEIDLNQIKEPLLACPNDPDDVRPLSAVQNTKIDEVFIGSCMTNIGHYRAAGKLLSKVKDGSLPTTLWIAPPTRMDEFQLKEEGYYGIFGASGARTEMPGCSLCMGNQARVKPGATVVSTSTRNFPNRLGDNTNVYLSSAELAAVSAVLGKLPTPAEYQEYVGQLNTMGAEIYRYLNFNEIESFQKAADKVKNDPCDACARSGDVILPILLQSETLLRRGFCWMLFSSLLILAGCDNNYPKDWPWVDVPFFSSCPDISGTYSIGSSNEDGIGRSANMGDTLFRTILPRRA
jgi:aconitate hydratase 2/2-methylisocitrate dehydratase